MALLDFLKPVGDIANKLIPDPDKRREFELELAKLADQENVRTHTEAMGQIEVNKIEAAHASVFVSGWRPALGWLGSLGFGFAFVVQPLLVTLNALWRGLPVPDYDTANLLVLLTGMLGFSGIRTFEKSKGLAFGSLKEPRMERQRTVKAASTPAMVDKVPVKPVETAETADDDKEEDSAPAPQLEERAIAWGSKVSAEFKRGVLWIEEQLKLNADFLMAVMAFETGRTFDPGKRNLAGSSGLGLIQFMSFTHAAMIKRHPHLKRLAPTHAALGKLTALQQLNFVYWYFRDFGTDFSDWTLEDVYMAVLYPKAIGKPLDWSFPWSQTSLAYRQNKGLDKNRDGRVTKLEASAGVRKQLKEGLERKG